MRRTTILTSVLAAAALLIAGGCGKETSVPAPKAPAAPAPAPTAQAPAQTTSAPAPDAAVAPAAPTPAPVAQPPAPAAPAPAIAVLASGEFMNDPELRCDLLEVKRVSGGSLTVRWRLVSTVGQSQGLTGSTPKKISYNFPWSQIYYTDPVENKKYGFLSDSQGNRLVQVYEGQYEPGQQRVNWAKFPAPPVTSKKISIHIPNFPPFEDIAVAE